MRIERTGNVQPLQPRVERFLEEALSGVRIDDVQSHQESRIDFLCLRGLLAIELKALAGDVSERMGNLTDELQQRDDWPYFLGSAPMQSFLKNTTDPEGLSRRVLNRVGRAAINHLKKANHQLEAHCVNFPRRNVVRALILVNEDHEAHDPHTISYVLHHALHRQEGDRPLYEHIDLAIYMTERHAVVVNSLISFPTIIVEGNGVGDAPWKSQLGDLFVRRWAAWNGMPLHDAPIDPSKFAPIDHIPDSMPRHEKWRVDYHRKPYLRGYPFSQLRDRFDEIMALTVLGTVKGSPCRPPQETMMRNMEHFTHIMVEMAERGIPITSFPHEPVRAVAAAKRLGLTDSQAAWLGNIGRDPTPPMS